LSAAVKLSRSGADFSASELGKAAGCKPDVAHHRIQRMVELGVLKKVPESLPARYVAA